MPIYQVKYLNQEREVVSSYWTSFSSHKVAAQAVASNLPVDLIAEIWNGGLRIHHISDINRFGTRPSIDIVRRSGSGSDYATGENGAKLRKS